MRVPLLGVAVVVFLAVILHGGGGGGVDAQCDVFKGHWVHDESYPLYDAARCGSIRREFDCLRTGRPDRDYLKLRWQPDNGCVLPRFDGKELLTRLRGKKVLFVGDSLSVNQHDSFVCLLRAAVPGATIVEAHTTDLIPFVRFEAYNVTVMYYLSHYLVDIVTEKIGRVLKLNSMEAGRYWLDADVLIFNTGHWWPRRGPSQPWDYIQDGVKIYKDMDRILAFSKAMATWAKWVDTNIKPGAKRVFYQGMSPNHYNGVDWGAPNASCLGQTVPATPSMIHGGPLPEETVVKNLLKTMSTPVYLLDITFLSLLRKDGHPSKYSSLFGNDCSHWCLAGVPDTWNQILYKALIN